MLILDVVQTKIVGGGKTLKAWFIRKVSLKENQTKLQRTAGDIPDMKV